MLKEMIDRIRRFAVRRDTQERRAMVEAWSLVMGRESAELWLEALSSRDASQLFNA